MKNPLKFILREIIQVIPAVLFFGITFNLIVLTEKMMIRHNAPGFLSYSLATVSAIIVGKCLLIVNTFPYVNAFPNKPLIYNILWKSWIYIAFVFVFRMIEKAIDLYFKTDNTQIVYHNITNTLSSPPFWAIQIWFFMLLLVYIATGELVRVMGKDEVIKLVFGRRREK